MNVTKITYKQYVAIIECGGKAFAFYTGDTTTDKEEREHAISVMSGPNGVFDELPDKERDNQACYTLTE